MNKTASAPATTFNSEGTRQVNSPATALHHMLPYNGKHDMANKHDMTCSLCKHPGSVFKFYVDSCELVCGHCLDIEREHGDLVPNSIFRALGFLSRMKGQRAIGLRLHDLTKALIEHDRSFLLKAPEPQMQPFN